MLKSVFSGQEDYGKVGVLLVTCEYVEPPALKIGLLDRDSNKPSVHQASARQWEAPGAAEWGMKKHNTLWGLFLC